MNFMAILGVVIGIFIFLVSVFIALGNLGGFIDIPSIIIVVGGSIGAVMIATKPQDIKVVFSAIMKKLVKKEKMNYVQVISELVSMSAAKRKGEQEFQRALKGVKTPFLIDAGSILYWADTEVSESEFRELLETKAKTYVDNAMEASRVLKLLSKFPPAFGMMGTVLGLIAILQSLGDPSAKDKLGPAMAIALITTLYGIFFNNVFIVPAAEGIVKAAKDDIKFYEVSIQGIVLINQGKPAKYIEEKLNAYLLPDERGKKAA